MATQGQVFGAPQVNAESPLTSAHLFVGNSSGIATDTAITGDVTISNAGVTTLASSARLLSKIKTITRDLTAVTGTVAYTGVGFQPTSMVAQGAVASTTINVSAPYFLIFGMSDSSKTSMSISLGAGSFITNGTNFIELVDATGANSQVATISSYDADGFTLSWTKAGSPTGTATIYVLCYR